MKRGAPGSPMRRRVLGAVGALAAAASRLAAPGDNIADAGYTGFVSHEWTPSAG